MVREAEKAGMLNQRQGKEPGPWLTRPATMLRKTCGVELARIVWPDVLSGLYSEDEAMEEDYDG